MGPVWPFPLLESHFVNSCTCLVDRELWHCKRVSLESRLCTEPIPLGKQSLWDCQAGQLTPHAWHTGHTRIIRTWSWRWCIADHQVNGGLSRKNPLHRESVQGKEYYRLSVNSSSWEESWEGWAWKWDFKGGKEDAAYLTPGETGQSWKEAALSRYPRLPRATSQTNEKL